MTSQIKKCQITCSSHCDVRSTQRKTTHPPTSSYNTQQLYLFTTYALHPSEQSHLNTNPNTLPHHLTTVYNEYSQKSNTLSTCSIHFQHCFSSTLFKKPCHRHPKSPRKTPSFPKSHASSSVNMSRNTLPTLMCLNHSHIPRSRFKICPTNYLLNGKPHSQRSQIIILQLQ